MRVAIEGCGHGTLHAIYASVKQSCEIEGWDRVDLLIIGGDFQAVRNSYDLNCMSVPPKYRAIGDFHEYYSGQRIAPYLTLFVGGNHEASSHLSELYYGGWVAPNIYYLGAANVIRVGDLRIAGLSGIWKGFDYNKSHFERVPYTADEVKSLYHVREIDVRKLLLIREQVDVGISHDWPKGVEWLGDHKALFRTKEHLEPDAQSGRLGSTAAKYVMDRLRPPYWFAAHLHCKFAAVVNYAKQTSDTDVPLQTTRQNGVSDPSQVNQDEIGLDLDSDEKAVKVDESTSPAGPFKNEEEIDLDLDLDLEDDSAPEPSASVHTTRIPLAAPQVSPPASKPLVSDDLRAQLPASFSRPKAPSDSTYQTPSHRSAPLPPPPTITNTTTHFLALDKCLPHRSFLQLLSIPPLNPSSRPSAPVLCYDPEWLSILRIFSSHDPHKPSPPNLGESAYSAQLTEARAWIDEHIVSAGKLAVPSNFEITAPVYDGLDIRSVGREQSREYSNQQTKAFCDLLGAKNWWNESEGARREWRERKEAIVRSEEESFSGRGGRGRGNRGGRGGRGGGEGGRGRGRGRGWR